MLLGCNKLNILSFCIFYLNNEQEYISDLFPYLRKVWPELLDLKDFREWKIYFTDIYYEVLVNEYKCYLIPEVRD